MPKSTAPKRRRSPPKISALEKAAVRIMRKLYEVTGGNPQRWESLDNLGAVNADAAGIAYAVGRNLRRHRATLSFTIWMLSPSVCLRLMAALAARFRHR
jgi:hypothetical protein